VNGGGQCSHEHDQEDIDRQCSTCLQSSCQYPVGNWEVKRNGQV
jgi:hypothetical protein